MPASYQGISYADVEEAVSQREAEYGGYCQFTIEYHYPYKGAKTRKPVVGAVWHAQRGVHRGRVYVGECPTYGARGATTVPGAMLRALAGVDAQADKAAGSLAWECAPLWPEGTVGGTR